MGVCPGRGAARVGQGRGVVVELDRLNLAGGRRHRAFDRGAADRQAAHGVEARLVGQLLHGRTVGLQVRDDQFKPGAVQRTTIRQHALKRAGQVADLLLNVALAQFRRGLGEVGADRHDDGRGLSRSGAGKGENGGDRCKKSNRTHSQAPEFQAPLEHRTRWR
ncbi:hypothetical protein [Brevundimonas naejangsanensis]|uniref:DinB/UmuC family translesion DNA polymerase n=1 Tax=Brevundimonas naejangsanensis TaxID=588932 RepID=UPI0034D61734